MSCFPIALDPAAEAFYRRIADALTASQTGGGAA